MTQGMRPVKSPPRPHRGLLWIGVLVIAGMLGMAAYDILSSYRRAVDDTGRQLDAQARIIAEQTARSVQAVDVVLRHIAQQYRQGTFEAMRERDLHQYLRDQTVGLVQIDGLLMIDAGGGFRASSRTFPAPKSLPSFRGRPAFESLRAGNTSLVVESAVQSDELKLWVFPIGRRLESPSGAFAGVIGARGRIDYYQKFYADIELDAGSAIILMHQNGTLLARYPAVDSALGKRIPLFDDRLELAKSGKSGPSRNISPVDGIERFGALQLVQGYPLAVLVTRDVTAALAPWRAQAIGTAARTLALAALAAAFLWLLMRQFKRLDETRRSLEVSQERFALAVAGSDDGIFVYDFRERTVFTSARGREISGLDPEPEMLSMDDWFEELPIHPEDAPRRQAAMQSHLEGRTPAYEGEFRMRQKDGRYRWVRVHGVCTRDADGKPLRMAGSSSDVDDRRRAEEALRESQERFALAVAGSNDGIVDWDLVNDRMYTSERALQIVGLDSTVTTRPRAEWARLIEYHPEDAPRMSRELDDFLAGRTEMRDGEYRIRLPGGDGNTYRWIRHRNRCVRDASGKPLRVAGSVSDIDAQKRAEEALRASEEQYRAIFNSTTDALILRDATGRIVDVNRAWLDMNGLTREEALADRDRIFASPELQPRIRDMVGRALAGETINYELQVERKQGEIAHLDVHLVPVLYRGQAHSLSVARDITEQKRAEAERTHLESQLLQAKKLEAIGTLAGGIAHDFNNILSAILGYGEMAQKGASAGTPLRRHVDAVVSAGMRAKSLVERILAFSRSGIGERVPVHAQSVVAEALDLVQASLPAHVRLVRKLDAGDAAVMGDPTQIHQVVMNLCANAAQAIKSSGTLTVSLGLRDKNDSLAATSLLAGGRYVRLRVRDTGIGIPQHVQERIFDPFFTTKEVGVGTGLGLSLVHGIVTDLGGGIQVESREGEGTTITVYLPWCDAKVAVTKAEDAIPAGAGETILLVDDEETLVRLGEEMIAGLGYEPVGFTSSTAALEAFRAAPERFNAVLSDESMPDMAGSELAREIRRIRPGMPIVLMTGFVSPALQARAGELGVADILAKPLVSKDIARSLAAALNR
jgi:PAS domain S-box-containing protein